jgi:hypothetical protein
MPSNATRGVGIYNQRSYFKAAVAMRRDYDPIKSWVANEITPSNKTLYLVGGYCSMVTTLGFFKTKSLIHCQMTGNLHPFQVHKTATFVYQVKDMREAFAKHYGAKPVLSCTYSAKLKQQAVSEVKVWLIIGVIREYHLLSIGCSVPYMVCSMPVLMSCFGIEKKRAI